MDDQKELEKLVDGFFESDQLDSPSMNFTNSVLEKVGHERAARISYAPLLPKWVWFSVGLVCILITGLVITSGSPDDSEPLYMDYLKSSSSFVSNLFGQLELSNIMGYVAVAVGIMICFQASILTRNFNRRLAQ